MARDATQLRDLALEQWSALARCRTGAWPFESSDHCCNLLALHVDRLRRQGTPSPKGSMKNYFTGVEFPELVEEQKPETEKPKQKYTDRGPDTVEALRIEAGEFNRLTLNILNAVRSGESELARASAPISTTGWHRKSRRSLTTSTPSHVTSSGSSFHF